MSSIFYILSKRPEGLVSVLETGVNPLGRFSRPRSCKGVFEGQRERPILGEGSGDFVKILAFAYCP